ncbi:hypothetical protein GCM10023323_67290 [Streptomyces thinghirensis]|uniref:Uncharacterized protein n=1 Tax=Streptomyces thinghirensis TaxID=551547 RepID=A0ABP9TC50_9ACTN
MRLRTLADVSAYAEAKGIRLRIDGAETPVRRPKANHPADARSTPGPRTLPRCGFHALRQVKLDS